MVGWPLYDDIVETVGHGYLMVVVPVEGEPALALCPCKLTPLGQMAAVLADRETRATFYVAASIEAHRELRANGFVPTC